MTKFKIKNYEISKDSKPFIIAESGINHNGDVENALKMIKNDPMIKNDLVEWKLNEWIDSNK